MKTIRIAVALVLALQARGLAAGDGHEHHHGTIDVPAKAAPTLRLTATPDSMSGWNLRLVTTRFRFTPERVGGKDVPGEGHAHLYVDGEKVARLYGEWFHLPPQLPGKHLLRVTLNANSHGELAVAGTPIAATVEIEEPAPTPR